MNHNSGGNDELMDLCDSIQVHEPDRAEDITLEEETPAESTIPKIVMIKNQTKYCPAKVIEKINNIYKVQICGKEDIFEVEVTKCQKFEPNDDMLKGQKNAWKDSYNIALTIYNSP